MSPAHSLRRSDAMDTFWWRAAWGLCLVQLSLAQIDLNITCRYAGVFHVEKNGRYSISKTEAADLCKAFNSTLPTMAQMEAALNIGFETCRYGFIDGHVVIPRIHPNAICAANNTGVYILTSNTSQYDTYCFNASAPPEEDCTSVTDLPNTFEGPITITIVNRDGTRYTKKGEYRTNPEDINPSMAPEDDMSSGSSSERSTSGVTASSTPTFRLLRTQTKKVLGSLATRRIPQLPLLQLCPQTAIQQLTCHTAVQQIIGCGPGLVIPSLRLRIRQQPQRQVRIQISSQQAGSQLKTMKMKETNTPVILDQALMMMKILSPAPPRQFLVVQQKKQLPRKSSGLRMDGPGGIPTHPKKTLMQQQGQLQPQPMTAIQVKERPHRAKWTVPGPISSTQSHTQWDEVIKRKEGWMRTPAIVPRFSLLQIHTQVWWKTWTGQDLFQ
uniref:CD44 antigen n=1 Tax=Sus scrofa TaxID=9823 RepID=A0A4X1SPI8_PIG